MAICMLLAMFWRPRASYVSDSADSLHVNQGDVVYPPMFMLLPTVWRVVACSSWQVKIVCFGSILASPPDTRGVCIPGQLVTALTPRL